MGSLDPSDEELSLLSKMQYEAAKQKGNKVSVKFVDNVELNNQHDADIDYDTLEELDIILQERPRKKVLRAYGWYNEDEEYVPILAYISKENWDGENLDLLRGMQIELPYNINNDNNSKIYSIAQVRAVPPKSLFWVCKLVPYREDFDNNVEDNENQDDGYNYLKVDEEDDALH